MSESTPPAAKPASTSSLAVRRWEPPSPAELQALMSGYTIQKLLGKGGMGAVYQGIQENLERPVAIKIISNDLDETDASYGERFRNEARAMAHLSHAGIVAVYDYGQTTNGILYIVMEFIEGTDVAKMISQQKRLHTEHAMAITAHVCDALAYAHERGIIHRDIKPANIMVGYDGVVKVADFGLAKMTKSGESGLTQSGMAMGTLHYMAPEALMLGRAVDHRADIYAVGVMLYQMLTGKVPHGMFELPSMQVPGLDPRYDEIIAKAMREDRELRYQSIRELRGDLDSILTRPVVQVEADAPQAPAALPTQARPQRSGGQPHQPPQAPVNIQKKNSPLPWVAAVVMLGLAAWLMFGRSESVPTEDTNVGSPAFSDKTPLKGTNTAAAPPKPNVSVMPTSAISNPLVVSTTKEQPYVNTLGQEFVPVPGTQVLFCRWETRVKDYTAYAQVNKVDGSWTSQQKDGVPVSREPEYPVCGVSWDDAKAFCRWLTEKERLEGKLLPGVIYRLPTDEEWSRAAGLAGEEGVTPKERAMRNKAVFPWGTGFTPSKPRTGNYRDSAFHEKFPNEPWIEGYTDGFATTAPVGSFASNDLGIHDLDGNVMEWCEDFYEPGNSPDRVLRGSSWLDNTARSWSHRGHYRPGYRFSHYGNSGFRCVLASGSFTPLADAPSSTQHAGSTTAATIPAEQWIDALPGVWADKNMSKNLVREKDGKSARAVINAGLFPTDLTSPLSDQAVRATVRADSNSWGVRIRQERTTPGDDDRAYDLRITRASEGVRFGFSLVHKSYAQNKLYPWPAAFDWNAPHTLEFRVVGSTLSMFLDGQKLDELTDMRIPKGYPMMFADTGAVIERFEYADLSAPPPAVVKITGVAIPELASLDKQFVQLQAERVTTVFETDVAKLNNGYLGGLDREIAKERVAGRLDGVLALEEEKKLITAKQPVPGTDDASTNPVVKHLRTIYRDAYAKLETARMANSKALTDPLSLRLKTLEADLTKQNRLADAKTVREYGEALSAREIAIAYSVTRPFVNSLGMKFVPLPGTGVLMCIHETRKGDYAKYAAVNPSVKSSWRTPNFEDVPVSDQDDHPVTVVNWYESKAFCDWLSQKEGRAYRLPTDREWSYAVGIGDQEDKQASPQSLNRKVRDHYPWGTQWPPPAGAGNFADTAFKEKFPARNSIEGYGDGFATTAPVMSFKPNQFGIHDLAGNVYEWCEDWWNDKHEERVVRGVGWDVSLADNLLSSLRQPYRADFNGYLTFRGFRCVLEASSLKGGSAGATASAPPSVPTTKPAAPITPGAMVSSSALANSTSPGNAAYPHASRINSIKWAGEEFQPSYLGELKLKETKLGPAKMEVDGLAFHPDGRIAIAGGNGAAGPYNMGFWSKSGKLTPIVELKHKPSTADPVVRAKEEAAGIFWFFSGRLAFDRAGACYFTLGSGSDGLYKVLSNSPVSIEQLRPDGGIGSLQIPWFDASKFYVTKRSKIYQADLAKAASATGGTPWFEFSGRDIQISKSLVVNPSVIIAVLGVRPDGDASNTIWNTLLFDRQSKGYWYIPAIAYSPMAISADGKTLIRSYGGSILEFSFPQAASVAGFKPVLSGTQSSPVQ